MLKSIISRSRGGRNKGSLCPCVKYVVAIKALPGYVNPFGETEHLGEGALVTPEAWEVT